jgi:putative transposase
MHQATDDVKLEERGLPQHFKVHEREYPYFVTSTVVYLIPVFVRDDYFRVLTDSLVFCCVNKGLVVHAFVIMPNHFHVICSHPDGNISDVIRDIKKHTSKQITRMLEEDGRRSWLAAMKNASGESGGIRVWEEGFHPEQVRTQAFYEQKLDYIHNNPIRAGFVCDPSAWKYSSAAFYYKEDESPVPVTPILW